MHNTSAVIYMKTNYFCCFCKWTLLNKLEKNPESPLDRRKSNKSILKEIIPKYSLEGLVLKLKLQYIGHLMQTANSLEKSLMLGKIEGRRRRGHQRMRRLDGITNETDMNLSKLREMVRNRETGMLQSMGSQRVRNNWMTEQQMQLYNMGFMSMKLQKNSDIE